MLLLPKILAVLPQVDYSVTITDAAMDSLTLDTVLSEPAALLASSVVNDVSCNTGADGFIDVTVSGGTPPYTYLWNNGATTEDINNQMSGHYNVTISDANSCSLVVKDTIGEPSQFLIISGSSTAVSCFGGSDGSASLTVVGGILPYTYSWSNGATTKDLNNVPAGTYSVIASDNNGCKDNFTLNITEPSQALSVSQSITDASCFLSTDGAIDLSVSGGVPPYSFSWNTGDTTEDLTNITAGNYSVTVTDGNGCTLVQNQVIQALDSIPPIASCQNISVYLDATGNASVVGNQFDNGSTDNCSIDTLLVSKSNFTCADLGANSVQVFVFDSNGNSDTCQASVQVMDTVSPAVNVANFSAHLDAAGQLYGKRQRF
ncbi:MAG: SprB repeat-containing protein [Owenweeksia sp.]|nr:SprB repeat-containing protein [Owenweeksia sp.]